MTLTPDDITKLLMTSRTRSVRHRELQFKRHLEQQLGHTLTDSQARAVYKRAIEQGLIEADEFMRPKPELGATHIVAQRIFYVHPRLHLLESFAKTATWFPGEIMEAECKGSYRTLGHDEVSPVFECSCGIWVCSSRAALKKSFPNVFHGRKPRLIVSAQVEVWGKCIEHEWGWRAQYARIIPETIQVYPRVNGRRVTHERLIGHLRRKYGG